MKKILVLIIFSFALYSCDAPKVLDPVGQLKVDDRPNILLIMADDLGYSDIAPFGGEISTPNLDALAAGGIKMSNLYAASACSPTRTMLLGGADSHRGGIGTMYNDQAPNQVGQPGYEGYMNHDVVSVATLLQDTGYNTYMTGKWHLGYEDDQSPEARGFERSFGLLQGGSSHFDDQPMTVQHDKSWFRENGKMVGLPEDFFSTQFYTDKMINYMELDEEDGKPFFAYLAYTAPHWPLQAPTEYLDKYKGRYDAGYENLTKERHKSLQDLGLIKEDIQMPAPAYPQTESWENISEQQKKIDAREMEIYAAMVDNMDFHIGRVLDYLEASGQRENTIIIFMSDNGAAGFGPGMAKAFPQDWIDSNFDNSFENMGKKGSYIYYGPHWARAGTAPSRMFKGFSSEGGLKVPGIINWGDNLAIKTGGFNDQFVTVHDLPVTFLEIAETQHPGTSYKGRDVYPYVGTSILPYLSGKKESIHGPTDVVAWELHDRMAVRKGDWKIIKIPGTYGTGDWELFNIKNDPGERNDLSTQNLTKLSELIADWETYALENGVITPEWK